MRLRILLLIATTLAIVLLHSTAVAAPAGRWFDRIFIVLFENSDPSKVLSDPHFSTFARRGTLLTDVSSASRPSQPNYLALIGGSTFGVTTDSNVDLPDSNLVDKLEAAGITWKTYQEDYPGSCFTGATNAGYARKHNPFMSFNNIRLNTTRCAKIVPAPELQNDLNSAHPLPMYIFYTPNRYNDGHDTGMTYAGNWLNGFLPPLLSHPKFANTLVVLTWDEGSIGTTANKIISILIGAATVPGTNDTRTTSHYGLLRTIEDNWSLGDLGRNDASAKSFLPLPGSTTHPTTTTPAPTTKAPTGTPTTTTTLSTTTPKPTTTAPATTTPKSSTTVASTTAASSSMPVGNLPGWTQFVAEDFTRTASVPLGSFGASPYASLFSPYNAGSHDTSGFGTYNAAKTLSVANGVLDAYLHTESGVHYVNAMILRPTWDGSVYGRYSYRIRVSQEIPGYKIVPLLWPNSNTWVAEVDFPEVNTITTTETVKANLFHGGDATQDSNWSHVSTTTKIVGGWHVYTIEWAPTGMKFFIDNVQQGPTFTDRVPSVPMHFVLQYETAIGVGAPPDVSAGHVELDWIVVYHYTPTTSTPAPTTTKASTTTAPPTTKATTAPPTTKATTAPPTTKATTAPPTTKPADYVGCFTDGSPRALTGLTTNTSYLRSNLMTIPTCKKFCGLRGYTYSGLQYGIECWCGQTTANGRLAANDSECYKPCPGNNATFCGGDWRNSVYKSTAGYLGCFVDSSSSRDFTLKAASTTSMTIPTCLGLCQTKGYAYAGLQWNRECWCGNSYGKYGAGTFASCNRTCLGDATQMCGGSLRNSVYSVSSVLRAESSTTLHHSPSVPAAAVVGICVAGVLVAAMLAIIVVVLLRARRQRSHNLRKQLLPNDEM